MVRLDRTNLQIIEALEANARLSVCELARELGRGETTVRDRLSSLERAGVLRGFRAVVDPAAIGYRVHAILRARCESRPAQELAKELEQILEVSSAQVMTGPTPLRIEIWASDVASLESLIERRLLPLGIHQVETALVLQDLVVSRPPPVTNGPLAQQNGMAGRSGRLENPVEVSPVRNGASRPPPTMTHPATATTPTSANPVR